MTSRIAHLIADVTYVRALPGAVFFGEPMDEDIDYAAHLQRIRNEYEGDDCQEMLWHDCQRMGFDSKDISRFVTNPSAITSCGYYGR
jgi:hypothetical protein